ncbi:MAG: hypothetical protein A2103_01610 [Gammaproteobacteria bacterium GWF2_41_13]|nr:MAG: hypothetical protein A2103_01610 [Gammaproteobacteria bacterium GWF2_41_13]
MKSSKITALTSFGAGLEYYDFIIYALLSPYISEQFFPTSHPSAAMLATLAVFAIGYLIRPIGGIIFGMLGDRFGRKHYFALTLLLMALSTFCMGIAPTYHRFGLFAPLLFIGFRIIQGISFGAELPGSLTFLIEHIHEKSRGTHCGFMISSVGLGSSLGALIAYLTSQLFTTAQMTTFGWRIPFLLGGFLAIIAYFIRKKATETPAFLANKAPPKYALVDLLRDHPQSILQGFGMLLLPTSLVIFILIIPAYFRDAYHYTSHDIYLGMTISQLWCAFLLPIFGRLSDRVGRKRLLLVATTTTALCSLLLFQLLTFKTKIALFAFLGLYETLIAAMAACYFTLLAELFPTRVRYTGVALCYNTVYAIVAMLPMLIHTIYTHTQSLLYTPLLFTLLALVTTFSVWNLSPG